MLSTEEPLTILTFERKNFFFAASLTLQVTFSTRHLETKAAMTALIIKCFKRSC